MSETARNMVWDQRVAGSNPATPTTSRIETCTKTPDIQPPVAPRNPAYADPLANKFHVGNGDDAKHYWLTPPDVYQMLNAEFTFTFDPCPFPKPADFDGLTNEWGVSNYVNPPFGSIIHKGKKKGPTAWARKAIAEAQKGKRVVLVYPIDKWVLMLLAAGAQVRNLGDIRWLATEDGSRGKGTGRHIAAFILDGSQTPKEDLFSVKSNINKLLGYDEDGFCEDCPPVGYSTDKTRCLRCPRKRP